MEPETEVVQAPPPQAPPPSLQERMTESVAAAWPGATTDSATVAAPSAEVPAVEAPAGVVPAPVETTPPAPLAVADDTPYTPEQLKDSAFWGSLDREGWAKAERLHPVETKLIKSAQAAASRLVNAARKEAPAEPVQPAQPAEEAELTPEHQALLDTIELGTPKERFDAYQKLAAMTVQSQPEVRAVREKEQRAALMQQARDIAVNGDEEAGLPPFPELEGFDEATLNAAYAKDPEARALASIGTPQAIGLAMRRVGQTVLAQKHADTVKFEAEQEQIRRNANTPVSNAVRPGAGGPIPTKPQTPLEFVLSEWGKAAVRASQ